MPILAAPPASPSSPDARFRSRSAAAPHAAGRPRRSPSREARLTWAGVCCVFAIIGAPRLGAAQASRPDNDAPAGGVAPRVVTPPVDHDSDDPALWLHPTDPAKSLVVGTDKDRNGGLYVFDLQGRIVARTPTLQRPNNVDIAQGGLGGEGRAPLDLAVTTEREALRLRAFALPSLKPLDRGDLVVFDGDRSRAPMGIALYRRPRDGALFAIVGGKGGPAAGYLWQYRLELGPDGLLTQRKVREFGAYSGRKEIEAIAVDAELGYVYYSDETYGVRKYHADPDHPDAARQLAEFGTTGFAQDHEGISIYRLNAREGYILVSNQQADTFRVFPREGSAAGPHAHPLLASVRLKTHESDGHDVTSVTLPGYPGGLLVAMSTDRTFQYYAWDDIASAAGLRSTTDVGAFAGSRDIGTGLLPGSSSLDISTGRYRITGGGANIWGKTDAFHFLSKPLSGDLSLACDIAWEGAGSEPHRKAAVMLRESLDADAPYVDVAVHGDGLIELQVRREKGGTTVGVRTPVKAPARVRLERDGDVFTASVSKDGGPFQPIGALSLPLPAELHVGLAVSAHNAANRETALFSSVALSLRQPREGEKRVRETSLETLDIATGERRLVWRELSSFEAPNWSRDGKRLYINRSGGIYTLPAAGGEPVRLDTGAADKCNNDHGLSFDGQWLAISSGGGKEGSRIHVLPATGGAPRLVTPLGPSYWHGWSPDGSTLVYCARRGTNFDIYSIPTAGGEERRLTTAEGLDDGCEYTADGQWIYFNSERTGTMQLWRMRPDGSGQERVTDDARFGDWFPHPSPDGKWLLFLSFDGSVKGHPANQNVTLRLMPLAGGKPRVVATLFGGQGTINVPSWSPDSRHVAFVSYRHVLPSAQ